jgi:predicted SprT family Zn-dependent metalloprotease
MSVLYKLAERLFSTYGLKGWRLKFDRALTRVGRCTYSTKTISLSIVFCILNEEKLVYETLLHEIAHALAFIRHGSCQGHNKNWKAICVEIGASQDRLRDLTALQCAPCKAFILCLVCNTKLHLYRFPKKPSSCRCVNDPKHCIQVSPNFHSQLFYVKLGKLKTYPTKKKIDDVKAYLSYLVDIGCN